MGRRIQGHSGRQANLGDSNKPASRMGKATNELLHRGHKVRARPSLLNMKQWKTRDKCTFKAKKNIRMLHHSSTCGFASRMHSTTTTARQDDTTRRGIDLIFIISLTFRRGKLGLVCASLMLPITSSLLKYRSESEAPPAPGGVPQPNDDHPDQGLKSS